MKETYEEFIRLLFAGFETEEETYLNGLLTELVTVPTENLR
jgi:hypothetical protein